MTKRKKTLWVLPIILVFCFLGQQLAYGAQENINELLEGFPPNTVLKEGPVVRVKKQTPPRKKVALTFDDGPDPKYTPQLLEILQKEQVVATFFVVGERVGHYPDVVRRINREGHLIANHSFTHTDFEHLTNEEIVKLELDPASKAVEKLTGYYPLIMRPPYGSLRTDSVNFLRGEGWHIVRWSLDTFDWDRTRNKPERIINRILELHHPNAIVLMHCNNKATVEVLPQVIKTLRDLGYDFVTVTDLN